MRFNVLILIAVSGVAWGGEPRFVLQEIDPHVGNVCYALTVADVNHDGRIDIVAVSEEAVVWYQNPAWERHDIIRGTTARDNVCIAPRDIDGDGRIDFALGAGWKPPDSQTPGTLQWLGRDAEGVWQLHAIDYEEPLVHRMQWADVLGTGQSQLVVVPLQGRGTKGPDWGAGAGVRVTVLEIPEDPRQPAWPVTIADESLHTIHNLAPIDFDGDGDEELLLAAWEGVFLVDRMRSGEWIRRKIGTGDQEASPYKGASEIKAGTLADGSRYIATIEPWHGNQVAVYEPTSSDERIWRRSVIAAPLAWGHAVWCSDLDGDPDQELLIGQRDANEEGVSPRGPGLYWFDPVAGSHPIRFERHTIDEGGLACEDALAADLDGDGRIDVVGGGRATHNVRIYWNRETAP